MEKGGMITDAMLDERLAIVGTAGSGKTYLAKGAAERLIRAKARICMVDPLGVWWGLRAGPDGSAKNGLPVTIFGGLHADVAITEHDGAALGKIIAGAFVQCIVDVSEVGSGAARQRFMLGFMQALYDANRQPLHIILDEADMFAPQSLGRDDGVGPKLLGLTEQIVRRGRVRGFVPWLITQRPAVLNKNVLSQADILIAMKLTSTQDRAAIGAWIEGQADRDDGRLILADLPKLQRGSGYVWAPGHNVLERVNFPPIATFDSSATPKRGEALPAAALAPVDVAAVASALAKERAPEKPPKAGGTPSVELTQHAYERGLAEGRAEAIELRATIQQMQAAITGALGYLAGEVGRPDAREIVVRPPTDTTPRRAPDKVAAPRVNGSPSDVTSPQRQVLAALAWWEAMGHVAPSRAQVAGIIGWKITSGHLKNVCGQLRSGGMIDYRTNGTISMTDAGRTAAPQADLSVGLHDRVRSALSGPQRQVFDLLADHHRGLSRERIASALGWEVTSGHVKNVLGSMRTLEVLDYPQPGHASLQGWLRAA